MSGAKRRPAMADEAVRWNSTRPGHMNHMQLTVLRQDSDSLDFQCLIRMLTGEKLQRETQVQVQLGSTQKKACKANMAR